MLAAAITIFSHCSARAASEVMLVEGRANQHCRARSMACIVCEQTEHTGDHYCCSSHVHGVHTSVFAELSSQRSAFTLSCSADVPVVSLKVDSSASSNFCNKDLFRSAPRKAQLHALSVRWQDPNHSAKALVDAPFAFRQAGRSHCRVRPGRLSGLHISLRA